MGFKKLPGYLAILLLSCTFVSCVSTQTRNKSENSSGAESLTVNEARNDLIVIGLVLTIKRPVEEVFAYLVDPDTVPEWQTDIYKQVKITDGPMRVGTILLNSRKSLLGKYKYEREIVNFVPLKTVAFYSHDKSLEFKISYDLEPVNGGTKIAISGEFKKTATGFYRYIPQWILKYGIKKVFLKHHHFLKMNIEKRFPEID